MKAQKKRAKKFLSMSGAFLLALTLAGTGCSSSKSSRNSASAFEAPKTFEDFELKTSYEPVNSLKIFHYIHKPSGLEILLSPKPGIKTVAYITAFEVGSRFEEKGRTGLAHLFEHMMFRGTENFPEPFKTLSGWGNSYNAYTSYDLTLYYEVVPKVVFADVVEFEAERMRKLKIDEEGFNKERGAVVSERKMRTEDSPFGRLYWELWQTAFDVHPYKTGPIGWQEDLDATTFQDALDFYERYYAPNRATLALVGDFSVQEALEELDKHYGDFAKVEFKEPEIPQEPELKKNRRKVINLKSESVILAHAVRGLDYKDPAVPAESLFCTLLTDSRVGYLHNILVEKQNLAKSVSAGCSPNVDPGLTTLYVVANPGVGLSKIESAVDQALKGFGKWLSQQRVEKAKMYYLAAQWGSLRDPDNLAEQIARSSVTTGNPLYDFEFLKKAQDVSLEEVLARYKNFMGSKYVRAIVKPSEKNDPFVYPGAKDDKTKKGEE